MHDGEEEQLDAETRKWLDLVKACSGPALCLSMAWEVRGYHNSLEFSLSVWLQYKKPLLDYLDGMWNGAFWKVDFEVTYWSSVDDAKEKMEAFAEGCVCRLFQGGS